MVSLVTHLYIVMIRPYFSQFIYYLKKIENNSDILSEKIKHFQFFNTIANRGFKYNHVLLQIIKKIWLIYFILLEYLGDSIV